MHRKVKLYTLALKDIENAAAFYQLQQRGLGKKFEKQIHATLKKIQKFPFASSLAYESV